jgi:hypothetical protein
MNATLISAMLAATIPTVAVLIGILINRSDASRLSAEIRVLDSKIDATRQQLHNDIVMLMNIDREQDARITRLEAQS